MSQVIDAKIDGNSRVFFVKGDRTAIVDTGAQGNERNILRALRVAGIAQGQVSVIAITHAHWDHCGSAQALKTALKVPIIAGWPDAGSLEKGENVPVMNLQPRPEKTHIPGPISGGVKADVILTRDMGLSSYGIDATVIMTPGHTAGSLSVLASNGDCTTGDFLASLYSGDADVIGQSLKKLANGGAKCFYPSHGPNIKAADIFNSFFTMEK